MSNIISVANILIHADDDQIFVAKESTKSVEMLVDKGEGMTK